MTSAESEARVGPDVDRPVTPYTCQQSFQGVNFLPDLVHIVEDEDGLKPHVEKEFQWKGVIERYQEFMLARLLESKKEVYRNGSSITLYMQQRSFDKLLGTLIVVLVDVMRLTKQEEKDISEPIQGHALTLLLNLSLWTNPHPKVTFQTPEIRLLIKDILQRPTFRSVYSSSPSFSSSTILLLVQGIADP